MLPGYSVAKLLGTGGFGAVWEAKDPQGRTVALKVGHTPDPVAAEKLRREGDALALVGPPFVPAFYARGLLADGRPYFAMERLLGRTLSDELESPAGAPGLGRVIRIARALVASVAATHERRVLHRDLKPENVFLVEQAGTLSARLVDFGLARSAAARAAGEHTMMVAGAGTPEYMSPEQISGRAMDSPSDVYSLGLLLFELFTLRLPFFGEAREVEYAHLSLRPPRPSRFGPVPAELEAIILRCLAKEPSRRYADAGVLRAALEEACQALPKIPTDAPPAEIALSADAATATPQAGADAAPAALKASDRQKVALIFVQAAKIASVELQNAIEPFGGQLASSALGKAVCAFTYRAGNNPGERALLAAEALIAKSLVERVIVDVATVVVRARPNGPPRLFSPLFNANERYPSATDPRGVLLSPTAAAMLPNVPCEPAETRLDHFVPVSNAPDDLTTNSRTVVLDMPALMVGRDEILRTLTNDALQAAAEKRPRVASVLADAGLGKTRLAFEVSHWLRSRYPNTRVIELRAREPLGRGTDEALTELVRRALGISADVQESDGRELLRSRLAGAGEEIYTSAALLLGWIPQDHPAVQALRAAPGVLRANAARTGMTALCRAAQQAPVCVLLDDAHWADDALLDALEQATASELPLWVVALGRPFFMENRPTWGARASHALVDRLEPLNREAALDLCRELLLPATNVPEPVLGRLVERAEARPLSMCDMIRGLKREGLLRKRGGDTWYVATEVLDAMPDSPVQEWIVGREMDELPAEVAAHARLAALLSFDFTFEEVEGVLELMDADLADAFPMDAQVGMERLLTTQLLVQHRGERITFRNAATREAVSRTVPEELAGRVHGIALQYYRRAPLVDATRLPSLAWHAAHAGERKEAAATYLKLADDSRERHNFLEADLLYTRSLEQLDDAEEQLRLSAFKGRGIVRYRLGRSDGSLSDLAQARELAVRQGDPRVQADVMLEEAMALDWVLERARSRDLAEQARELVKLAPSPTLEARSLFAVGLSLNRFNRDQEGAALLREAVRIAEPLGDESYEVTVTASITLGFSLPFLGFLDEADEHLARAERLCQKKGDELHLAAVWTNRACLCIALNDRENLVAFTNKVLAYARRMGNAGLERAANHNIAFFLHWRGEFEAAEPFARRMIEIDERYFRQGGSRPEGGVLLARILWGRGQEAEARQVLAQVRQHQETARLEGSDDRLLPPSDQVLLQVAGLVILGGDHADWLKVVAEARGVAQGQELIEVLEAAALAAQRRADLAAARAWIEEAVEFGRRLPNVMQARIEQLKSQLEAEA